MSQGFAILRQHIPQVSRRKKLSKVETLRYAVDYIRTLSQIVKENPQENHPPAQSRLTGNVDYSDLSTQSRLLGMVNCSDISGLSPQSGLPVTMVSNLLPSTSSRLLGNYSDISCLDAPQSVLASGNGEYDVISVYTDNIKHIAYDFER